jgi:hypothetical protein
MNLLNFEPFSMLKQLFVLNALLRNYYNATDTKTVSLENSTMDVESFNVVCNNDAGFWVARNSFKTLRAYTHINCSFWRWPCREETCSRVDSFVFYPHCFTECNMIVIPVAVRSMAYGCSCLIAGITGPKIPTAEWKFISCLLCVVQVAASETSWSLVHRSPAGVCV